MREVSINRNSLLYRLATVYGSYHHWNDETDNICDFTRALLKGSVVWFATTIILALVAVFVLGYPLTWLVYVLINGWLAPDEMVIMPVVIILGLCLIVGIGYVSTKCGDRIKSTVAYDAYQSWKDKYCIKVNLKD